MDFLASLALFACKTFLIAGAIVAVAGFLFQMGASRSRSTNSLDVQKLNLRFRSFRRALSAQLLDKKQFKKLLKEEKKSEKGKLSEEKNSEKGRVFVLDFEGDLRASAVASLREEITAILMVAKANDEVVLRLESGGGLVTSYGLAAAQLVRLKTAAIKLTICVDKVAASGGYMMACVANRILATPFAVVGSIGVIAQVPNLNKLLKKHDVDYREVTAGEFKRTVTMFGEIHQTGLDKFKEQIEGTHQLFKQFVKENRPALDIQRVATGEHWFGTEALALGLVDELITSDEYISRCAATADVYRIEFQAPKKWLARVTDSAAQSAHQMLGKVISDFELRRFGL